LICFATGKLRASHSLLAILLRYSTQESVEIAWKDLIHAIETLLAALR